MSAEKQIIHMHEKKTSMQEQLRSIGEKLLDTANEIDNGECVLSFTANIELGPNGYSKVNIAKNVVSTQSDIYDDVIEERKKIYYEMTGKNE